MPGVLSLRANEKSLGEVARLLDVQPEALAREVAQVSAGHLTCSDTAVDCEIAVAVLTDTDFCCR